MTGTNFASYIRYLTKTNSTTLTDAQIVLLANVEKDNLAELITSEVSEGYFDMEDIRDLEASTRNYTYPADLLRGLRYVSAKLDGTNWSYLRELDFGYFEGRNLPLREESWITNEFSTKKPRYYLSANELWLLSGTTMTAVTGGLKIVSEVYPEDIATGALSSSTDLSVPSSNTAIRLPRQAHKIWAKMVSIAYKSSKDKPLPLTADERKLTVDLDELYQKLEGRNTVRNIIGSIPSDDGQDY